MKQTSIYFLIVILVIGISYPSFAQIKKGEFLLAGSTSFATISTKTLAGSNFPDPITNTEKTLVLTPEIGTFIADNIAIGLAVQYNHDELTKGFQTYTSSSLIAIPFIRAYFGKEKLKPFVYGGYGFGKGTNVQTGYGTSFDNIEKKLSMYEFGGGLAFFVNKNISLEFGVAYSHVLSKYPNSNNVNMEDTGKGTGFTIGINLFL